MDNKDIISKIISFRDERDWGQFHTLKDLCLGIGIEVAELQELFLWKTNDQIETIKNEKIDQISEEIADVFIFLAYLCKELNVDLDAAVLNKIEGNAIKYPIGKSKGSNKKYNEL